MNYSIQHGVLLQFHYNYKMNLNSHLLLFFFVIFYLVSRGCCYFPVICIPGFLDATKSLKRVCNRIAELHPGTRVYFLQPLKVYGSIIGMWEQVELYRPKMNKIFKKYPNGVNVIAHSQGTLITRGIMLTTPDHPIKNFLSVAGPWMGHFGVIGVTEAVILGHNLQNLFRDKLSLFAYTNFAQDYFSWPGYWNDPHRQALHLRKSKFLAIINNQKMHPNYNEFKKNFLRLNTTVMFGSPNDGIVYPWQSTHSGFYDDKLNIVLLKEQHVYKNDTYGLRTLDERGGLTLITIPGPWHLRLVSDLTYTDKYYIHYLH